MKMPSLIFLLFTFSSSLFSQQYTIYLTKDLSPTKYETEAVYERHLKPINDTLFSATDFHLNGWKYQSGYIVLLPDSVNGTAVIDFHGWHKRTGENKKYYQNGSLKSQGAYLNGKKDGIFEFFYSNGEKMKVLEYSSDWEKDNMYFMDEFHLVHEYYDSLGNVLVKEGFGAYTLEYNGIKETGAINQGLRHGVWTGTKKGAPYFSERYENGDLTKGISYDSLSRQYAYNEISTSPTYEGGLEKFYWHVAESMKYPVSARRKGIEGRVYVQFIVNKQGKTEDIKTIKGIDPKCDQEAERAIRTARKFKPGLLRGQPVKVKMVLPIIFKLS